MQGACKNVKAWVERERKDNLEDFSKMHLSQNTKFLLKEGKFVDNIWSILGVGALVKHATMWRILYYVEEQLEP